MKKLLIIITIAFALSTASIISVNAQEGDIIEDTEATQSSSLEGIKKIINDNIKNSKVAGAIDDLLNRKIGLIGQVTRITDETITIDTRLGTRIIALDDTVQISKNDKIIPTSEIAIDNWVMILGKLKDDNFSPNFIYVNTNTLRPKDQKVFLGTINEITTKNIKFLPRANEDEKTLDITSKTIFLDSDGTEVTPSDFSEDLNALVTAFQTNDGIKIATIKSLVPILEVDEEE